MERRQEKISIRFTHFGVNILARLLASFQSFVSDILLEKTPETALLRIQKR